MKIFIILLIFDISIYHLQCFDFSVIIAIYNTGRYLDDSIGSLINQTIKFEKIQIILVNDGSTDNSEKKCLKYKKIYPNNIIYIKIAHGGVSRARNVGMKYAKGKYINFLDADDKWDSKSFRFVSIFFNFYKNIDIVAGRLKFFEAMTTYHPLDYKFYKTRVVNLTEEYKCIHISGPSSFFRNSLLRDKKFEEGIFSGEDTILINNILLLNPIIGFIREAIYYYRKRSDSSSAVQTQCRKVEFYFSQIKNVGQYLLNKSKELYNKVLPFIQFYIGYNVLFRILSPAYKYLNVADFKEYCNIIEGQLKQIEDKYILGQMFTSYRAKLFALSKKYNKDMRYELSFKNDSLIYSQHFMISLKNHNNIIIWRILEIKQNILHLEGKDNLYLPKEKYFFYCNYRNKTFFPKYYDYSGYDFYTMYGLSEKGRMVTFDIPIENSNQDVISFFISYMDGETEIFPSLGSLTHIPSIKNGYYSNGNYIIKMFENRLKIYGYNKSLEQNFEKQYCIELKKLSQENIINLRTIYIKNRDSNKQKKNVWLINDKQDKAGDNGEFFFRFLINKNIKNIEIYFVITKDCEDYKRMKKIGNILELYSNKYLSEFLNADKIITSVSDSWVTNPFGPQQKYIRDLFHFDVVYIPNGIIKDDLSFHLNMVNKNFSLLITSSKKEYKSILSSKYGYNEDNVILTGLSRFDNLKELIKNLPKERLILLIPTWRNYITGTRDLVTYKTIYSDSFKNTSFYSFYNNLINDQKLILKMKKLNYTGIFCLHPYFSQQREDFVKNKYFSIKINCNYQELLAKASLFITDYSSIFFDFAYLRKPIIYSQFDLEEYRVYQYPGDIFDYKKHGFGPVCKDIDCLIEEIIKQITNDCIVNKNYLRRIDNFFTFSDQNNNDRILYEILNNKKKKSNKLKNFFILLSFVINILKLKSIFKL